jgi:hypothetical protein
METEVNKGGMIFNRTLQYFAYAGDVNLVAGISRRSEQAFQRLQTAAEKAGLKINKKKQST